MSLRLRYGLIIAAALAASPAVAALVPYYHSGVWDAFSGPGDNGGSVCGIGTTNPNDRRSLSMRWPIGGQLMIFQANKPTWSIPNGTPIQVVLQIDSNPPWTVQAVGHDRIVSWTMSSDVIQEFDQQFRRGSVLAVNFPGGSEPQWVLSLNGSTAISNTFGRCITDMSRTAGVVSPIGGGGTTEPYGQAPTQPGPTQPMPTQPDTQPQPDAVTQPNAPPPKP
jgi:hypothetical protein